MYEGTSKGSLTDLEIRSITPITLLIESYYNYIQYVFSFTLMLSSLKINI